MTYDGQKLDRSTQLAGDPGTFFSYFSYMMCRYEVSLKENPLGKGMVIHYFVLSFSSVGVRGTKLSKKRLSSQNLQNVLAPGGFLKDSR